MATRWFRDGSWWAAVAGGAIAFPIAVLLHELGHFLGYTVFGFPDPVLHYGSAAGPTRRTSRSWKRETWRLRRRLPNPGRKRLPEPWGRSSPT